MIKAKKSLGQNFLRDKNILKKIADFARIGKEDTVVEIGPGEGTLTEFLLERAGKVIAIEKDDGLAEQLKQNFKFQISNDRLEIICDDILKLEIDKFIENYVLVGNIPYYITGALFKKALEAKNRPKSMTFVVQKEVAERIMAKDKKESILSISIKAYGRPEYGGVIKAGSFSPRPKVDSAIIAVRDITPLIPLTSPRSDLEKCPEGQTFEKKFFEILKKGFSHKRKLLSKNLGVSRGTLDTCGISEKARAENLTVENWLCLAKSFPHKT